MGKMRLGFDLGSSSMKIAIVRQGGPVRLEEVRLPENLMDGSGTIARCSKATEVVQHAYHF